MADYQLLMNDYNEVSHTNLTVGFETDSLDRIVEEFYWFIKRSGFDYVTAVTVEKSDGNLVEFSCE